MTPVTWQWYFYHGLAGVYAESRQWYFYHLARPLRSSLMVVYLPHAGRPQWMEISDVHEAHQCKISWLAVSKITTNEIAAFSELLIWSVPSYDGWKGEGSWNCWGIGLACTNVPEQVVMMRYDRSNLVFGGKASYQCIRLWLRCVVFIVNWITGHFHVLITSQTTSEAWACLVPLDLILRHWPLGLQTKFSDDALCVVFLLPVCICVCVFDLAYHYPLLY